MCGVCIEVQNPSITPSLVAAGFAGVATGGRLYVQQLRTGVTRLRRSDAVDESATHP